jgi:cysteinyl-tRNA synthetase
MLSVLALDNLLDPEAVQVPAEAQEMADARERARLARDYAEADRIREELREQGWEVRDSPDGPELLPLGS